VQQIKLSLSGARLSRFPGKEAVKQSSVSHFWGCRSTSTNS